jgi:selenium metabolism protein YedF
MLVDARGAGCPKPVMMAEDALTNIDEGSVEVLVDNEASAENLARFAAKSGLYSETTGEDGYWRTKIMKGYVCAPAVKNEGPEALKTTGKDLFIIIASDTMGKDEALGKILMKAYLDTMKTYRELPHTIFFLNAGVKLTTIDADAVSVLKEIEEMGVEIFSCGTCLKHYNLESDLKVGYRGTTNHILEGIKDFRKTVWIG